MSDLTEMPAASDAQTPQEAIQRRMTRIKEWLAENGPHIDLEKKHLDSGSQERVYWHYGYYIALRDVLKLLQSQKPN